MTIKRILILFALVILAMAAIARASAQGVAKVELPEAPTPATTTNGAIVWHAPQAKQQVFLSSRLNRALILANFGVRLADAITTEDAMHNKCKCFHETQLPNAIVQRPAAMYAYSFGIAAGLTIGSKLLWDHNHHTLARILLAGGAIGDGEADFGNVRNLQKYGK